jgi:hypothetical protein
LIDLFPQDSPQLHEILRRSTMRSSRFAFFFSAARIACVLILASIVSVPAQAATINVAYSLSGAGAGDVLNPPLIGSATGSLTPLGNVTWSDMLFPNLATAAGDGTFKMTFTDGDTLFGTLHEQGDFSTYPIGLSRNS